MTTSYIIQRLSDRRLFAGMFFDAPRWEDTEKDDGITVKMYFNYEHAHDELSRLTESTPCRIIALTDGR